MKNEYKLMLAGPHLLTCAHTLRPILFPQKGRQEHSHSVTNGAASVLHLAGLDGVSF